MIYDFHSHTTLSDGSLSPLELIRRAHVSGYGAIALTDHTGPGELANILEQVTHDCALARQHWDIKALPGVELTHLPPEAIAETASLAKELGAQLVVAHGETLVEPVPPGTNRAAIEAPHVDILAHPGLLSIDEIKMAADNSTYLEISARRGHCLGNGHLVQLAFVSGARLLVNSDAHDPEDLLTEDFSRRVAIGAGLNESELDQVLRKNPIALLQSLGAQ
jgi:histidinol phosphatase-like PHP family hydrolase